MKINLLILYIIIYKLPKGKIVSIIWKFLSPIIEITEPSFKKQKSFIF